MNSNFVKKEREMLILAINDHLFEEHKKLFTRAKVCWYLDGKRLRIERSRMIINDNYLLINDLTHADSGTYYSVLEFDSFSHVETYEDLLRSYTNHFLVVGIYTVIVVNSQIQAVSAYNITNILDCRKKHLELFIENNSLEISWFVNFCFGNSRGFN